MKNYQITTTMTVDKKGRKWAHCTDNATDRQYKVLISDELKDIKAGDQLTGEFDVNDKSDKWGVNRECTYKPVDSAETIDKLIDRLVEVAKEYGSISDTTSKRILPYKDQLTDEQKARIHSVNEIVKNYQKEKYIQQYLGRLDSCVDGGYWSKTQVRNLEEMYSSLSDERVQEIKDQIAELRDRLDSQRAEQKAAKKAEREEYRKTHYSFYDYSGFYTSAKGDVISHDGKIGRVVKIEKDYVDAEMAMSTGHYQIPDGGYYWTITLDLEDVTDDEKAEIQEREAKEAEEKALEKEISTTEKKLSRAILDALYDGTKPEKASPEGDILYDSFKVYGSGEQLILDGDKLWTIKNKGMDGDFWGDNNMVTGGAGAFATYHSADSDLAKGMIVLAKNLASLKAQKGE